MEGSIDKDEGDLLKNAIGFSEQEAQDILIHRVDLAALPVDATKEEVADLFTQTKYSRLLIYREDIDHIIGTIHQKDFYVGCGVTDKPLEEILSPVMFVLENEPISLLLKKLQLAKTQMAVVVDEYGGTCGIVTMEDILEELVARSGTSTTRRRSLSARWTRTPIWWTRPWILTILPSSSI